MIIETLRLICDAYVITWNMLNAIFDHMHLRFHFQPLATTIVHPLTVLLPQESRKWWGMSGFTTLHARGPTRLGTLVARVAATEK